MRDTVWQGQVSLDEDVVVRAGVTLTVAAGTTVTVSPASQAHQGTDPEYASPLVEITVRGTLRVEGSASAPVRFRSAAPGDGNWAGVLVDRGVAVLEDASIQGADTGLQVQEGTLTLRNVTLQGNRCGLAVDGVGNRVDVKSLTLAGNDFGWVRVRGAPPPSGGVVYRGNRRGDHLLLDTPVVRPPEPELALPAPRGPVLEVADTTLRGDTTWSGRVRVRGVVRVPPGARLIILPGTLVEVTREDRNADGVGDNGFLVQGVLLAKGTASAPIRFHSSQESPLPGDWDAINIMNSDGPASLIEFCHVEDAYRGVHFHFSNVEVQHSRFRGNVRALQFQESTAEIRDSVLVDNESGIHARDSRVGFQRNLVSGNGTGLHFFRVALHAVDNVVAANRGDGIRIREGSTLLERNVIDGNRFGLLVHDAFQAALAQNLVSNNLENGISIRNADGVTLRGNALSHNGVDGLGVQDARLVMEDNFFGHNGDHGLLARALTGVIRRNQWAANGRWAVEVEGPEGLDASGNAWGTARPGTVIRDGKTAAGTGNVNAKDPVLAPAPFSMPPVAVINHLDWEGAWGVESAATIAEGGTLRVHPGTTVTFAPGAGLRVLGKLVAQGTRERPITFTSRSRRGPGEWDEITLEHASGSLMEHCVVEHATWALHVHFSEMVIRSCTLQHNEGGLRFRSGPVVVEDCVVRDNGVGIRAYRGDARILRNRITDNGTGIFVREKGGGLQVHGNDLSGNRHWALRLGDFNDEDVDATGNCWGPHPADFIHDSHQEPGIGTVHTEPTCPGGGGRP